MANALAGASAGWLALGVLLHLANQAARGRGWYAIVRAASPDDPGAAPPRRDPRLGGGRRSGRRGLRARRRRRARAAARAAGRETTRGSVLTGTLVAEAAGDALVGVAVIGLAVALGAAPALRPSRRRRRSPIAGGVLALLALAGLVLRRRGGPRRARSPPASAAAAPRSVARARSRARVLPWQAASRALRAAAIACFLLAFGLPAGVAAVLLVMLAQSGGRLLPLAPASAAASVAMLAAGFGPATGAAVAGRHRRRVHARDEPAAHARRRRARRRRHLPGRRPGAPAAVWRAVRPRRAAALQPQD